MMRLEPLVAQFVEDLLRCIRAASLDDLEAALGPGKNRPRARAVRPTDEPARLARVPIRPAEAPRNPTRRRAVAPAPASAAPRAPSEITNPDGLLAMGPPALAEPAPLAVADPPTASKAAPEAGAPASGPVAVVVGLPVHLRDGETLLRASGAGIVFRRARGA